MLKKPSNKTYLSVTPFGKIPKELPNISIIEKDQNIEDIINKTFKNIDLSSSAIEIKNNEDEGYEKNNTSRPNEKKSNLDNTLKKRI